MMSDIKVDAPQWTMMNEMKVGVHRWEGAHQWTTMMKYNNTTCTKGTMMTDTKTRKCKTSIHKEIETMMTEIQTCVLKTIEITMKNTRRDKSKLSKMKGIKTSINLENTMKDNIEHKIQEIMMKRNIITKMHPEINSMMKENRINIHKREEIMMKESSRIYKNKRNEGMMTDMNLLREAKMKNIKIINHQRTNEIMMKDNMKREMQEITKREGILIKNNILKVFKEMSMEQTATSKIPTIHLAKRKLLHDSHKNNLKHKKEL